MPVPASALLALAFWLSVLPVGAGQVRLAIGGETGPLGYEVTVSAAQRVNGTSRLLEARYEVEYEALEQLTDATIPVSLRFGAGDGTLTQGGEVRPLAWSYEGREAVLFMRPCSVAAEVSKPLARSRRGLWMDPLASYFARAWAIRLPEEPVEVGQPFVFDVEDEPSLTGELLVSRRIIGQVERIEEVEGMEVAFLSAEVEEQIRDDHPDLAGSGLLNVSVALDVSRGVLLGATILEHGQVTVKRGRSAGVTVRTDQLECRVRLKDGPPLRL